MTLPLVCFGNIRWFALWLSDENFVVEGKENYPKQTYRNRYEIVGPNGKLSLTIPVVGQDGIKTPYREIKIDKENWAHLHTKSLLTAYNSSPFFVHYADELFALIENPGSYLFDFNLAAHELVCRWLQISPSIEFTEEYVGGTNDDHRSNFKPSKQSFENESYEQVFSEKRSFITNLSVLDLIFNLGPEAAIYLQKCSRSPAYMR